MGIWSNLILRQNEAKKTYYTDSFAGAPQRPLTSVKNHHRVVFLCPFLNALQGLNLWYMIGRSHNNDLIEKAFVENILKQEAENIARAQDRVFSRAANNEKINFARYSRSFQVSDSTLRHSHHIQQRFIDMKRTRFGKQKPVAVHNSIIYGHWNTILFRSKVELTNALRAQMALQLNLEL